MIRRGIARNAGIGPRLALIVTGCFLLILIHLHGWYSLLRPSIGGLLSTEHKNKQHGTRGEASSSSGSGSLLQVIRLANNAWYASYVPLENARAPHLKYPVWWAGPFRSASGYGAEAISYALGMLEHGLIRPQDLWITQSGDGILHTQKETVQPHVWDFLTKQDYQALQKVLPRAELDRPAIVVCHSFPDCWKLQGEIQYLDLPGCPCPTEDMDGKYAYRIGRTMWEMDRLPPHLVKHVNEFDEVWVPSEWNKQTFIASGVAADKLAILPQGINLTVFDPAKHKPLPLSRLPGTELITGKEVQGSKTHASFVFLSIFKWESRKGWELLLKAFVEEFKADEDVELHIATHAFIEKVDNWRQKIRTGMRQRCGIPRDANFEDMPRIYATSAYIADKEYPGIYKAADALVIPTRGEGWGRPQMEAMAMGLPVISTNWSGLTAFLTDKTGYPIAIKDELLMAQADGPSFFSYFKYHSWAQPRLDHLKQLMRHVFAHHKEARAKGAAARKHLQQEFSPEAVGKKLQQLILAAEAKVDQRICERRGARQQMHQKQESSEQLTIRQENCTSSGCIECMQEFAMD